MFFGYGINLVIHHFLTNSHLTRDLLCYIFNYIMFFRKTMITINVIINILGFFISDFASDSANSISLLESLWTMGGATTFFLTTITFYRATFFFLAPFFSFFELFRVYIFVNNISHKKRITLIIMIIFCV